MIKIDKGKHYHGFRYNVDFTELLKIIDFFNHLIVSSIDHWDKFYDKLTFHNLYVIFIKPTM